MLQSIIDSREREIEELKSFTDTVDKQISDIVGTLGWTVTSVTEDKEYMKCPYDPFHRLTEKSFSDHTVACQWKAEGYGKMDVPLSESTLPADSPFVVKLDVKLQDEILKQAKEQNPTMQTGTGERLIPRTSNRLMASFRSGEKRALYNYAIANTAKPDIGQDVADINDLKPQESENKELSFLELLVQERNLRRRRTKHRGVHTNKKSHIEICREVINQQMEIYKDYISGQTNSDHAMDVPHAKLDDSSCEVMRGEGEHSCKINRLTAQNHDDCNSKEKNGHYYNKRDGLKKELSEKKYCHRSRDRDRQERYSDEYDRTHRKHKHSKHRKSSRSKDRKSHKKDKYQSRDRVKDKRHERKRRSRDRENSLNRYTKHNDHRRKEKDKEY